MTVATETDDRADLIEALDNLNLTIKRLPSHYTDQRASLHQQMNDLLDVMETRAWLR